MHDTIEKIGDGAFAYTDITSIEIPLSVKYIGSSAFSNCTKLKSVDIPASVEQTGNSLFSLCKSLEYADFSKSKITNIRESTFGMCLSLKSVKISPSVVSMAEGLFEDCKNVTIFCKKNSYAEEYAKENNMHYQW